MSMLPFARNFLSAKGNQAAAAVAKALVELDPETASIADLKTMEQDLDQAGRVIAKLRVELSTEQHETQHVYKHYTELMNAAEILQKRVDTASGADKSGLEASLDRLVAQIEQVAPELDRDKKDVVATQTLLTEAEAAYQQKARALTDAKSNLERAKHNLQHANLEEERSRQRAQQAAVVAGLRQSPTSGLTVALNSMEQSASEARERAAAADMKAGALNGAKQAATDDNIASALAEASGTTSSKSVSERLAELKR